MVLWGTHRRSAFGTAAALLCAPCTPFQDVPLALQGQPVVAASKRQFAGGLAPFEVVDVRSAPYDEFTESSRDNETQCVRVRCRPGTGTSRSALGGSCAVLTASRPPPAHPSTLF